MKKLSLVLLFIFLVFPAVGCKKKPPVITKPTTEQVKPMEVKPETQIIVESKAFTPEIYAYDQKGRRDPFLALIVTAKKPLKKGASPFESYDIEEINLLAIAWDKENKYYALIMLPNKKAYTITEGMTLGLQGGKVEKITKNSIIIREFVQDYRGETKARESILKLHKGEEE